jgi:hypothetical protein
MMLQVQWRSSVRLFGNFLPLLMLQATLSLCYPSPLLVSQTLSQFSIDGSTDYCTELPSVTMYGNYTFSYCLRWN